MEASREQPQNVIKLVGEYWISIAQHPAFATFANVLGVLAGFLGALYTEDIRVAFPLYWGPYGAVSIHACIFWLCFTIFALTFLSREWSIDKQRVASLRGLQETIRTMPPRGFVVEFAQNYAQCYKAVRALDSEPPATEEQVRAAVRLLLWCIATLARRFDAAQQYDYAANIMLYWTSEAEWQKHTGITARPDVKFAEREAAIDRMALLILDITLSATTASKTGEVDPGLATIPNLALPVPAPGTSGRSEDGKRLRVLPGAPLTYFDQIPNAYGEAEELGKWCRESGDFSESVSVQVEEYFRQEMVRKSIRSFASLPIISIMDSGPIGVVNLHSNGPNMLTGEGVPSQFFPLAEPFTTLLADTLLRLLAIPKATKLRP